MVIHRSDVLVPHPCVYILMKDIHPVYVGQTVNLFNRLYNHANDGKEYDHVVFHAVPKKDLNVVEGYLIASLNPTLNIKRPLTLIPNSPDGTGLTIEEWREDAEYSVRLKAGPVYRSSGSTHLPFGSNSKCKCVASSTTSN